MTQLWLVPVDEPSFRKTLDEPVDLRDYSQKPAGFPARPRVWGVRTDPEQGSWERNRRNLERMQSGDPLLFYRNSQSEYHATGRVGEFWHTEHIRDEYWNGGPAIDVFSVEEYETVDATREVVNRLLDYKQNFWPQGLWRVADDRPTNQLVQKYNL